MAWPTWRVKSPPGANVGLSAVYHNGTHPEPPPPGRTREVQGRTVSTSALLKRGLLELDGKQVCLY